MHLDIFPTTLQPSALHIAQAVVHTSMSVGFYPGPELSRAREPLISTDMVTFQARRICRWPLILIRLESSARGQGSERKALPGGLFVPTLTLKRPSISSLETEITQLTFFF